MFKLFKKIKLVIMRGVLVSIVCLSCDISNARDYDDLCILPPEGILPKSGSYVGKTTSILHGNCNPYASPDEDILPNRDGSAKQPHQLSCEGRGIDLNSYRIEGQYVRGAGDLSGLVLGSTETFSLSLPNGTDSVNIGPGVPLEFSLELDGDKACVYGAMPFSFGNQRKCGVVVNGSVPNASDKQNITGPSGGSDTNGLVNPIDASLPIHCIPVPPPLPRVMDIQWGGFFSPVCTDYDSSTSNFKYPGGENRAFTGVVVECVIDTMNNIFKDRTIFAGQTLFERTQEGLKTVLRYLLVLYVMMFGFPFIYGKQALAQEKAYWFVLRFAMVWFFSVGTGMAQLLPYFQVVSTSMSMVVLEASSGLTLDATTENANVIAELAALKTASATLNQASRNAYLTGNYSPVATARAARDAALVDYNTARFAAASYGYRYCDFRQLIEDVPTRAYLPGKEHMRLWDTIDCKISKFLGVGDNLRAPRSPHLITAVLAIAASAIGVGLLMLILCIAVTVFFLLVVIRVVSIYIMSAIGLILLVYISPLIIPTALFKYTRYIFKSWLSQIVAYIIQPVILFAFLGFMFAAFDMAMFGGNHSFVPMTDPMGKYSNKMCMAFKNTTNLSGTALCTDVAYTNTLETQRVSLDKLKCDDETAMGCILQKIAIRKDIATHDGLGVNSYNSVVGFRAVIDMFFGLLQMFMVSILAYAVFGVVEKMSVTLTNAAGGGATGLSGAPFANPIAIAGAVTVATATPVARYAGGEVISAVVKRQAAKEIATKETKDDVAKKNQSVKKKR
jgi:hypothetical protein